MRQLLVLFRWRQGQRQGVGFPKYTGAELYTQCEIERRIGLRYNGGSDRAQGCYILAAQRGIEHRSRRWVVHEERWAGGGGVLQRQPPPHPLECAGSRVGTGAGRWNWQQHGIFHSLVQFCRPHTSCLRQAGSQVSNEPSGIASSCCHTRRTAPPPAAGKMFMAQSLDKGESWSRPAPTPLPRADFKVATVTIDGQVNVFWGSRDWVWGGGTQLIGGPTSRRPP